jgi:hypothetical protein
VVTLIRCADSPAFTPSPPGKAAILRAIAARDSWPQEPFLPTTGSVLVNAGHVNFDRDEVLRETKGRGGQEGCRRYTAALP